jgi:hypothetical protein
MIFFPITTQSLRPAQQTNQVDEVINSNGFICQGNLGRKMDSASFQILWIIMEFIVELNPSSFW